LFRQDVWEQPDVATGLLTRGEPEVKLVADAIRKLKPAGFFIAARGSSDHAATYAKYLFEIRNRIPVALAAPSAFSLYKRDVKLKQFCVIAISQSGSSPDVVSVLRAARRQGAMTIAVTNEKRSSIAEHAAFLLHCDAGKERSIPASKTYAASLLLLAMLSHWLDPDREFGTALQRVPEAFAKVLELEPAVGAAGDWLMGDEQRNRLAVLGRGYHLATAQEIALKIMETTYLPAQARSVADFLHGPWAIIEQDFPVLMLEARGPTLQGMRRLARLLREHKARVVTFSDDPAVRAPTPAEVLIDSGLPEALTPLPYAVAGQLLAYHLALKRGLDPDNPRGLRKITQTR
jgi:glucosamine--fructose-6-phosphate aminotransferase (isomerizing)